MVLSQVVCLDNDQLQFKPDGWPFTYRVSELASYYVVDTILGTSNTGVTIVTVPSTLASVPAHYGLDFGTIIMNSKTN